MKITYFNPSKRQWRQPGRKSRSIGAQVWAGMESNRDLLAKTKSLRLEIKAATDLITTTNAGKIVSGCLVLPLRVPLGIQTRSYLLFNY